MSAAPIAALRVSLLALAISAASPAARAERVDCDIATPELHLPLAPSPPRRVLQSYDGTFSHMGRYRWAWDFSMPVGTPVFAAADGVVVEVLDEFGEGGPNKELENQANKVVLDHGNNRFSVYQHLLRGPTPVHEGDRVVRGTLIGRSGNSGWTQEPHLHFHVVNHLNQTQPICFSDVPGGRPDYDRSYRRTDEANRPAQPAQPIVLSIMPRDTFAQNGVIVDTELLSRWLSRSSQLRIAGRTLRPGRQVAVWIMPIGSDSATKWWYGAVGADGRFTVSFDLAGQEGQRGFAIAVAGKDGRFSSSYSMPVQLHWPR